MLDTNVMSEPLRPSPNLAVLAWLDRQPPATITMTAVSLGELLLGVALLPAGRRRTGLDRSVRAIVAEWFDGRLLDYTTQAAAAYALLVARARAQGHPIAVADGQIAAIAHVHGFTVATRDTAPFMAAGVPVIDPWTA